MGIKDTISVVQTVLYLIQPIYFVILYSLLHEGQLSDSIKTSSGVRQGCLLSPLLFLLVMDGVLHRALNGKKRGLTWRVQESLEDIKFADDVCLVSHKYEHG